MKMHGETTRRLNLHQPQACAIGRAGREFIDNRHAHSGFGKGDGALGKADEMPPGRVKSGIGEKPGQHFPVHGARFEQEPVRFKRHEIRQVWTCA